MALPPDVQRYYLARPQCSAKRHNNRSISGRRTGHIEQSQLGAVRRREHQPILARIEHLPHAEIRERLKTTGPAIHPVENPSILLIAQPVLPTLLVYNNQVHQTVAVEVP